jgi:GxxExxY protein
MQENDLSGIIIGAAMKVHTALGPGLLESVYEACLYRELQKRGHFVERQKGLPVYYDNEQIEEVSFRVDLLVEKRIIVELKSVEAFAPIHFKTTLNYLNLSRLHLGLLINFNVEHLKDGIKRIVSQHPIRD